MTEEEKRRKYLTGIIETAEKHPSYGKKKLVFIDKDGKKKNLDRIGNLLRPDPEGTKFITEVLDVGSDTFYEVYDPDKLQKIVDEDGNILFEKKTPEPPAVS